MEGTGQAAHRGADIAIVEDDVDVRETLTEVLREEGYDVQAFADGPQALGKLAAMAQLPRLILLDLLMPKMDGWQFRAHQRDVLRLRDVPTVVLSADGNVDENLEALGVHGYLRKPIHIKTLLELVERFCGPPPPGSQG